VLSSPPLCLSYILWFRQNVLPLRACNPVQNTVHGFLDSGAGPVELPRGLGGKLTQHIPIPQSLQSIEHTIRAHMPYFSLLMIVGLHLSPFTQAATNRRIEAKPLIPSKL
jgi:hypothetical protein